MGIKISEATPIVNLKDSYMIPIGNVGNDEANATKLGVVSDYIENGFKQRDVFISNSDTDTETWVFELESGEIIEKKILIKK